MSNLLQPSVTLRAAHAADCAIIADLLGQLYAAELPGALIGPPAIRQRLLSYTLSAENYGGLRGRYLAVAADGAIIGTAATQMPHDPPVRRAPTGTLRLAFTLLGGRNAAQLMWTLARTMVLAGPTMLPQYAYVHGIVVREELRGQGWGQQLVHSLEALLQHQGMRGVLLQVVLSNNGARRLYERLGYKTIARSARWLDWLTFPTITMMKRF